MLDRDCPQRRMWQRILVLLGSCRPSKAWRLRGDLTVPREYTLEENVGCAVLSNLSLPSCEVWLYHVLLLWWITSPLAKGHRTELLKLWTIQTFLSIICSSVTVTERWHTILCVLTMMEVDIGNERLAHLLESKGSKGREAAPGKLGPPHQRTLSRTHPEGTEVPKSHLSRQTWERRLAGSAWKHNE